MAPKEWHFVTGCDSGFGSIVVGMLAAKGYGVFATHLMPQSADALSKVSPNVVPLHVDITQQESVDAAAGEVNEVLRQRGGKLVGVVNNAGLMIGSGPVEWTPAANYEKMFAVNVVGAVRVTNALLPHLRQNKGRIVNVASIAGKVCLPTQTAYSATKYAMEGYSDGLRRELQPWGITVHIIEPGVFNKTGLYQTYHKGVDMLWQNLSGEVKEAYGENFKKNVGGKISEALSKLGSADSTQVPIAMVHALTDERPNYRYRVGSDAKVLVPLYQYMLGESWQDALLAGPEKERVIAAKQNPADMKTAGDRYAKPSWRWYLACSAVAYGLSKL